MDTSARQAAIVAAVNERSRVSVTELAELTACSEMTIRRDLEALERGAALRRVHGGAVSVPLSAVEPPWAVRALTNQEIKRKLACACVELLSDGESIILDTGTTALEIGKALRGRSVTVAPLSAQVMCALSDSAGIQLMVPGGMLRVGELAFVGEHAERAFADLRFDTMILTCCGLDARNGASAHHLEDVRVKRAALASARRVLAVVTGEKLGRVAFGQICPPSRIDRIITSADDDQPEVDGLRSAGVSVLTV